MFWTVWLVKVLYDFLKTKIAEILDELCGLNPCVLFRTCLLDLRSTLPRFGAREKNRLQQDFFLPNQPFSFFSSLPFLVPKGGKEKNQCRRKKREETMIKLTTKKKKWRNGTMMDCRSFPSGHHLGSNERGAEIKYFHFFSTTYTAPVIAAVKRKVLMKGRERPSSPFDLSNAIRIRWSGRKRANTLEWRRKT